MALTPIFDRLQPVAAAVRDRLWHKWLSSIVIKRAFFGKGTLRVVASVVFVINTVSAQKFFGFRSIKRDTRMTESFESDFAVRTGERSGVYRLVTAGAIRHRQQGYGVRWWVGSLGGFPNAD
jgi:hypothetical protein